MRCRYLMKKCSQSPTTTFAQLPASVIVDSASLPFLWMTVHFPKSHLLPTPGHHCSHVFLSLLHYQFFLLPYCSQHLYVICYPMCKRYLQLIPCPPPATAHLHAPLYSKSPFKNGQNSLSKLPFSLEFTLIWLLLPSLHLPLSL